MAVTILEEPPVVALAYNPVRFKVEAEKLYETGGNEGVKSKYTFGLSQADLPNLSDGDTLSLALFGTIIDFTFTNSTTAAAEMLPTAASRNGKTYGEVLKEFLDKNHLLFKNYMVTVFSDYSVIIEARNVGGEYDLEVTQSDFANSLTWYCVESNAGEQAQFVTNRFVRGDLYIEDVHNSGVFKYYGHIENQIIDTDEIWFDFSTKFQAFFGSRNIKNYVNTAGMFRLNAINKHYYVVFTEYDSGGYDTVNDFAKSNTLRCMKSGVKEDEFRIFPDVVTTYLKEKLKVMSWRPNRREISPGQFDYLYFINWKSAITSVKGMCKIFYTDNTDETVLASTLNVDAYGELYGWNVGHSIIADKATIPAGEGIRGYECWWADNNNERLCESVFFTVKPRTYFDRYFFYESSWGTFEVFKTESLHSYGVNAEKEEVRAAVSATDDYNKGDIRDIVHEFVEVFKGSTGNVSDDEALALADFIISEHKYIMRGNRLVNITVPEKSITPYKDDGFPHGFKFTYKRATTQRKYSNLIGVQASTGLLGDLIDEGFDNELTPE